MLEAYLRAEQFDKAEAMLRTACSAAPRSVTCSGWVGPR